MSALGTAATNTENLLLKLTEGISQVGLGARRCQQVERLNAIAYRELILIGDRADDHHDGAARRLFGIDVFPEAGPYIYPVKCRGRSARSTVIT